MKEVGTLDELISEISKTAGIGLIPSSDGLRIAISLDTQNPHLAFDMINQFEITLVESAGSDLKKIKDFSNIADNIRASVIKELSARGIDPEKIPNYPEHIKIS